MRDFPNYLLNKKENNNNSHTNLTKNDKAVWKDTHSKKSFQPSNVPSILKGLTRENNLDYTGIKSALQLKSNEFLLFEINHNARNHVIMSKDNQSALKKTGLHRTFQQVMAENEHNHFILTKGDTHER